jgi:hypothetical protein
MLLSRSKGSIAELKIQIAAHEKNYTISKPVWDYLPYDLVIDTGKKLLRTQIKYCNKKDGKNLVLAINKYDVKKRKKYTATEIDLLLVYCPAVDAILAFNNKIFHNKERLTININDENSEFFYKKFIW